MLSGFVQFNSIDFSPAVALRFDGSGTPLKPSIRAPVELTVEYSPTAGSAYEPESSSRRIKLIPPLPESDKVQPRHKKTLFDQLNSARLRLTRSPIATSIPDKLVGKVTTFC